MKLNKLFAVAAALFAFAAPAVAQPPDPGNALVVSGSTGWNASSTGYLSYTIGDGRGFPIAGFSNVSVAFSGTYSGVTIAEEQTNDVTGQSGWYAVNCNDGTSSGSTSGSNYVCPVFGARHRIRVSAYTSGTINARVLLNRYSTIAVMQGSAATFGATTFRGNVIFSPDNTYNIGASGATRPNSVFVGSGGIASAGDVALSAGNLSVATNQKVQWNGGAGYITGDANGNMTVFGNSGSPIIKIGGTTSAFPALNRNGAALEAKLADNSAYATFNAEEVVTNPRTFGALPTCNASHLGGRKFITDGSLAASGNFGAVAAGGGANSVPVFCDGTSWKIG